MPRFDAFSTVIGSSQRPYVAVYLAPQQPGEVAEWLSALLRGLPDHRFRLLDLQQQVFGAQTWPQHVTPLSQPREKWSWRPVRAAQRRRIEQAYEALLTSLGRFDVNRFEQALHTLSDLGGAAPLRVGLDTPWAAACTLEVWLQEAQTTPWPGEARLGAPSVADAAQLHRWLTERLNVLSAPVAQANLGHAVGGGLAGLLALHAYWQRGVPYLLSDFGVYLRGRYLAYQRSGVSAALKAMQLRFEKMLSTVVGKAACALVVSTSLEKRWQLRLGADPARMVSVPVGLELQQFAPRQAPAGAVVGWTGQLRESDPATLLRAFEMLRHRMPEARLQLYPQTDKGLPAREQQREQDARRQIEGLIRHLNLASHVKFAALPSDPAEIYEDVQLMVQLGSNDAPALQLLRAMACGRPSIVSRSGSAQELVAGTGLSMRPHDVLGLASACQRLLQDHELRAMLSEAARRRAVAKHSATQMLDSYKNLYALARQRQPTPLHRAAPHPSYLMLETTWVGRA